MKVPIFCVSLLSVFPIAGSFSAALAQPVLTPSQNQILQNFRSSSPGFPHPFTSPFSQDNRPEPLKQDNDPLIPIIERDSAQPDCTLPNGKIGLQYRIRDAANLSEQGKIACVPQEYANHVGEYLDKTKIELNNLFS